MRPSLLRRAAGVLAFSALIGGAFLYSTAAVVATPAGFDDSTLSAFGRVFPDPHGCLAYALVDSDGDGIKDAPEGVSPWAKGRVCAGAFLSYEEVVEGSKFLARKFPRYIRVIRLDQAFENQNYLSAGIPRTVVTDDGKVKFLGRDRRPLYMLKITDSQSPLPESERLHFAYSLSIHGIERAGLEGGVRAMEDLVTWAVCEEDPSAAPACSVEGPFPKEIVETPSNLSSPTAGEVLKRGVLYFVLANPDGWARGQVQPAELEDGAPNSNYSPGLFFQRYNGNGVDLNRDWPTIGYTFKPYSPGSEPEIQAFSTVLKDIKSRTAAGRFAGALDLHGMLDAYAFSYTLLGGGQRDFRKNELTVDTAIRTWEDQTQRLAWSPYIADANKNGVSESGETCLGFFSSNTRGRAPACVADQWGTVIDTIGYQVTGGFGDWFESPLGLDAVGIDNEMYVSHIVPNVLFEPALEQSHIDGNKGLIYSQIASLLNASEVSFEPSGRIGYIFNPIRLQVSPTTRPPNPGLPAQDDIEVFLPCRNQVLVNVEGGCAGGTFGNQTGASWFEFTVGGPQEGVFNGGLTVLITYMNALGISHGGAGGVQLQYEEEGSWHTAVRDFNQSESYAQAGGIVTVNDPKPGRWRVRLAFPTQLPARVKIDFSPSGAEASPGQTAIDVSSMDFFTDLNRYIPEGRKLEPISVAKVVNHPELLGVYDTIVVANNIGSRSWLVEELALSQEQADAYFAGLRSFADSGGNLTLTDAALQALPELGVVNASSVQRRFGLTGNYVFRNGIGQITYEHPQVYPLAAGVMKPGAAEQLRGQRQAVEPTPLGYSPDHGFDTDPAMPFWGVFRPSWETSCGIQNCTTASTRQAGDLVNLGEAALGAGRVRVAGIMLPDPVFEPDASNDHRFGLASYALTYTAYEVFANLIEWTNPNRLTPPQPELSCSCNIRVRAGRTARAAMSVSNTGNLTESYKLEVTSRPADWTAAVQPPAITLAGGEAGKAVLKIRLPRDTKRGTYGVEVRVVSDNFEGLEDRVTATVSVVNPHNRSSEQDSSRPAAAFFAGPLGVTILLGLLLAGRMRLRG